MSTVVPPEGLNPAVGMHSEGEEVRLNLDAKWEHSDVILMSIDSCEEDWARLHEVRVNGQVTAPGDWSAMVFASLLSSATLTFCAKEILFINDCTFCVF